MEDGAVMELKLQNFRIGTRVGLALALPITGLLVFACWGLVGYYRDAQDIEKTRSIAEFAPKIGILVHAIQMERGTSAGFLGSRGEEFKEKLLSQYRETDQKRDEFINALSHLDVAHFSGKIDGNLTHKIVAAREEIGKIAELRDALAGRAVSEKELTRQYSEMIGKLIDVVEVMLNVSTDMNITRAIYAYTHLMKAKEYAGLERATGVVGFAAGRLDADSRVRFIGLIDRQQLYLEEIKRYISVEQAMQLKAALSDHSSIEVERMRRLIIKNLNRDSSGVVHATQWFGAMTNKIDLLKGIEDLIASDLIAQSMHAEDLAMRAVRWVSVITATILVLTLALAAAIARGIIFPLARITNSMSKLAARDETAKIEIKDCERHDEIGDMARAMIVFRENLLRAVQTEERMKSDARHKALVESSNDAIITTDSAGNVTCWNRHAEIIFGYAEDEVRGQQLTMLMPSRYRELHIAGMRRIASGEEPRIIGKTVEVEGLRKDQSEFPMEISLAQWVTDEGRFITATIRDISERKLAEQELRVAAIAFESQEGMMITDANKVILQVNRAFTQITGYSTEEAVGQTPKLLNSGHQDRDFYVAMWKSILHTGFWQGEIWNKSKSGDIYPEWLSITAVLDENGKPSHYVAAFSDITQRKQAEDKIRFLGFYDLLTQLPNRRLLMDRLQQALVASTRNRRMSALLFIDIDNFKTLNDTLGHDKGDLLLQQVARRLVSCVRECDTVARLGGDEFVVMLEELSENIEAAANEAEAVGEKIIVAFNQPYDLENLVYHSSSSIGITLFGDQREGVDELLKRADLAMYQAKAAGRNTLRFFDPGMQAVVAARANLEADLRAAVQKYEPDSHKYQFHLHYQAQVDHAGRLIGAEALLRWQHPQRGKVNPAEFIPLAEETGLILPLGHWVLETACLQLVAWAARPETAHMTLSVNVSARQFHHSYFVDMMLAVLDFSGANPQRLKLELTESMLVDDMESIIEKMTILKAKGVGFSLDDFGTGYSSLSYLKRLPLDQLKIDQSFVREVLCNPNDAAIACTIITLGQSLGLAVIAEGVETEAQLNFLAANGCQTFQGYLFGKPVPAEELSGGIAHEKDNYQLQREGA